MPCLGVTLLLEMKPKHLLQVWELPVPQVQLHELSKQDPHLRHLTLDALHPSSGQSALPHRLGCCQAALEMGLGLVEQPEADQLQALGQDQVVLLWSMC